MLKIKKVRPVFTGIVTSANKWEIRDFEPKELVYKQLGQLKDYQTVLAVGDSVREIKVGDVVMVSFDRYAVKKYPTNSVKDQLDVQRTIGYDVPGMKVDGLDVLVLDERDVTMVVEEYEDKKHEWKDEDEQRLKASQAGIYSPVSTTLDDSLDVIWTNPKGIS